MDALSPVEMKVAEEYCKGYSDKEVADNLNKSYWTVKTEKKSIYRKLGISKDTELLLYMICGKLKKDFDLKEIRKHGLEILLSLLILVMQVMNSGMDLRRSRVRTGSRTRIDVREGGERNGEV